MTTQQKVMLGVRMTGAGAMMPFIYGETGPWTVSLLILLTISVELQVSLWRRLVDTVNGKKIWS